MASIKKNFSWNLLLTICGYIFPFITYPYASRVMGVENMGVCGYVDSIINYLVLLSALGVGSLGVREIARCKDDKELRSEVFSNLLIFNMSLTMIFVAVLVACTLLIPSLQEYKSFLLIGVLKLVFQPLTVEWFFQGIQDFRYVTLRSLTFRALSVILLFLLVHTREDVLWYYSLSVITAVFSAFCNLVYSRRFVRFTLRNYKPFLYLVPILAFGYYRLLTSLYTTFNTFYLGTVTDNVQVGYFVTATKLNTIIMSVFTALTTVMVPKVAQMLNEGKKDDLQKIANKTFSILTAVALPVIIISLFCAPHIIYILSGAGYEGAVPSFRIVIFTILIIGMEQIVIQQFLMASRNNKTILAVSSTGAIVGLAFNFALTPIYGSVGTSLSWAFSELAVLIVGLYLMKKTLQLSLSIINLMKDIAFSLLYVIPLIPICYYIHNCWANCIVSAIATLCLFLVINVCLHPNMEFLNLVSSIREKLKK